MQTSFNKTHTLNAARHPVMATIVTANFEDTLTAYTEILAVSYTHLTLPTTPYV